MKCSLHKTELVHPIFLIIFIGIGGLIGLGDSNLFEFWKKDFTELAPSLLIVLTSYFIINALNTSQVVAIKNAEIIKGIYCVPFGFLKANKRINISDIIEIEIKQNEIHFYEIIIESNSNSSFLIKSIANKISAEKELNRIKTKINSFAKKELR